MRGAGGTFPTGESVKRYRNGLTLKARQGTWADDPDC